MPVNIHTTSLSWGRNTAKNYFRKVFQNTHKKFKKVNQRFTLRGGGFQKIGVRFTYFPNIFKVGGFKHFPLVLDRLYKIFFFNLSNFFFANDRI